MGKNVAVFVDVANIFYAAKAAGVDIDYVTLLKSATAGRDFVRAYAYTGLDPDNENQRNFHQFLARHQYKVVSKDIRKYGDGKVKANLDIELVVDMMKTARNLDVAVLVSGDGDFASAIRAVQEMGVRVEVISFRGNTSSDLIEAADQFMDITQIARVDKGSSRSGRRVAAEDDEDLSMTEVPDKLSEGSGRGRGRGGRGRSGGRSLDRGPERGTERGTERTEREPVAASPAGGRGLVALPGERLSRAAMAAAAMAEDAADDAPDADDVAEDGAQVRIEGEDGEGRRRRRRRGGRGRGRGREREDGLEAVAPTDDEAREADEVEDDADAEADAAPRAPRSRPFGSVWDSQLGTPAPRAAALDPLPDDDEDYDEPEIPEYLLAERRRNAGGGGRGGGRGGARGGARSAYAAAIERERYGGGRTGGVNRFAEPTSGGRGQGGGMRRSGPAPTPARGPRPDRERPAARTSSEPWSEVPPELEAMLLQQLKGGAPAPAGSPARGGDAATDRRPDREPDDRAPRSRRDSRPRREPVVAASVESTPFDSLLGGAPRPEAHAAEAEAPEAAPKRRTTRRPKADATAAPADATPTEAPAAEAEAPEAAPKRRTTRRPRADATAPADATPTEAPAAEAEAPEAAPKRRTTRRPKADATAAPADATPTEAPAAEAEAPEAAPKRRTTRRPKATAEG